MPGHMLLGAVAKFRLGTAIARRVGIQRACRVLKIEGGCVRWDTECRSHCHCCRCFSLPMLMLPVKVVVLGRAERRESARLYTENCSIFSSTMFQRGKSSQYQGANDLDSMKNVTFPVGRLTTADWGLLCSHTPLIKPTQFIA